MDVATHAVTGAVAWLACENRPRTAWGLPLAMVAAALPDADIFLASTPLDFLLLHRGITHSLAALPFMALIAALLMDSLWRKSTPGAWRFSRVVLFAAALLLIHIWLDCVTTYGTMIFTPFSDYRVRWNGLFIVDLLLLVPLLASWYFGRKKRIFALLGAAWIFVYPAAMVAEHAIFERQWKEAIFAEKSVNSELYVLPDVFAPLRWRAIYEKDGQVHNMGLDWSGAKISEAKPLPAADPALVASLSEQDRSCRAFFRFTLLPIQEKLSENENGSEFLFHDLRFASMIPFVQHVMAWRTDGDTPFKLLTMFDKNGRFEASKMVFSGAGRVSDFAPPEPPGRVSTWQWLIGIR